MVIGSIGKTVNRTTLSRAARSRPSARCYAWIWHQLHRRDLSWWWFAATIKCVD
jgi:hypothetical protein